MNLNEKEYKTEYDSIKDPSTTTKQLLPLSCSAPLSFHITTSKEETQVTKL